MKFVRFLITFLFLGILLFEFPLEAKKIKNTLRVEKEEKYVIKSSEYKGHKINLNDSVLGTLYDKELLSELRKVVFTGYEKEPNSKWESFLIVNPSERLITGFEIKIDYLDMNNRMLHSRNIRESCYVPKGETRKIDITSWDTQHTYYYYLGNEPRKVATPFKVAFHPVIIWIEEE
ncbi:MAG: hypothetical protein J1F12_06120 [Muribaculaceae bacterium]|nr:hypothetical protein [Muribaculaceae bacterium]